ncbi:AEC family transporter [Rarobacter incanus]|uniref:AEC family transporter n=1 Tax=Rarobacter incanus TaxID=153494 RepID=UPI0014768D47|nr:AEC family transporter [Rarobacter incanus]
MAGVLFGFGVIGIVIFVGYAVARRRVLGPDGQRTLAKLAFSIAMPALLFTQIATADLGRIFSRSLIVTAGSVVVVVALYVAVARFVWHRPADEVIIGSLASGYVNGGNLGIPIAVYVLGSATYAIPVMLWQLCVLAPASMAIIERLRNRDARGLRAVVRPVFRNPLVIAAAAGIAAALLPWGVPEVIMQPLDLLAGLAVPSALLAFGMSLHGGSVPGAAPVRPAIFAIVILKNIVQPAAAYAVARYGVHLEGVDLFAATLFAALPTAQNVFVYAMRAGTGVQLARDSIVITSAISIPIVVALAAVMV